MEGYEDNGANEKDIQCWLHNFLLTCKINEVQTLTRSLVVCKDNGTLMNTENNWHSIELTDFDISLDGKLSKDSLDRSMKSCDGIGSIDWNNTKLLIKEYYLEFVVGEAFNSSVLELHINDFSVLPFIEENKHKGIAKNGNNLSDITRRRAILWNQQRNIQGNTLESLMDDDPIDQPDSMDDPNLASQMAQFGDTLIHTSTESLSNDIHIAELARDPNEPNTQLVTVTLEDIRNSKSSNSIGRDLNIEAVNEDAVVSGGDLNMEAVNEDAVVSGRDLKMGAVNEDSVVSGRDLNMDVSGEDLNMEAVNEDSVVSGRDLNIETVNEDSVVSGSTNEDETSIVPRIQMPDGSNILNDLMNCDETPESEEVYDDQETYFDSVPVSDCDSIHLISLPSKLKLTNTGFYNTELTEKIDILQEKNTSNRVLDHQGFSSSSSTKAQSEKVCDGIKSLESSTSTKVINPSDDERLQNVDVEKNLCPSDTAEKLGVEVIPHCSGKPTSLSQDHLLGISASSTLQMGVNFISNIFNSAVAKTTEIAGKKQLITGDQKASCEAFQEDFIGNAEHEKHDAKPTMDDDKSPNHRSAFIESVPFKDSNVKERPENLMDKSGDVYTQEFKVEKTPMLISVDTKSKSEPNNSDEEMFYDVSDRSPEKRQSRTDSEDMLVISPTLDGQMQQSETLPDTRALFESQPFVPHSVLNIESQNPESPFCTQQLKFDLQDAQDVSNSSKQSSQNIIISSGESEEAIHTNEDEECPNVKPSERQVDNSAVSPTEKRDFDQGPDLTHIESPESSEMSSFNSDVRIIENSVSPFQDAQNVHSQISLKSGNENEEKISRSESENSSLINSLTCNLKADKCRSEDLFVKPDDKNSFPNSNKCATGKCLEKGNKLDYFESQKSVPDSTSTSVCLSGVHDIGNEPGESIANSQEDVFQDAQSSEHDSVFESEEDSRKTETPLNDLQQDKLSKPIFIPIEHSSPSKSSDSEQPIYDNHRKEDDHPAMIVSQVMPSPVGNSGKQPKTKYQDYSSDSTSPSILKPADFKINTPGRQLKIIRRDSLSNDQIGDDISVISEPLTINVGCPSGLTSPGTLSPSDSIISTCSRSSKTSVSSQRTVMHKSKSLNTILGKEKSPRSFINKTLNFDSSSIRDPNVLFGNNFKSLKISGERKHKAERSQSFSLGPPLKKQRKKLLTDGNVFLGGIEEEGETKVVSSPPRDTSNNLDTPLSPSLVIDCFKPRTNLRKRKLLRTNSSQSNVSNQYLEFIPDNMERTSKKSSESGEIDNNTIHSTDDKIVPVQKEQSSKKDEDNPVSVKHKINDKRAESRTSSISNTPSSTKRPQRARRPSTKLIESEESTNLEKSISEKHESTPEAISRVSPNSKRFTPSKNSKAFNPKSCAQNKPFSSPRLTEHIIVDSPGDNQQGSQHICKNTNHFVEEEISVAMIQKILKKKHKIPPPLSQSTVNGLISFSRNEAILYDYTDV